MKAYLSVLILLFPAILYSQSKKWLSDEAQNCLSNEYHYVNSNLGSLDEDEVYYLSAYSCFLKYIKNENKEQLKDFEKEKGRLERIARTNNLKISMMLINLDIQYGLMKLIRGDEMTGIYSIYTAYKAFLSLDKNKCHSLEYQKLNGLFLIFADQVQTQNSIVSWLFGIEGDEQLGFQLLRSYITQTKYHSGLHKEGLLILAYCGLRFTELGQSELLQFKEEAEQYGSPLLSFVIGMNAIKTNQTELLFNWVNTWNKTQLDDFPYLRYIKGRLLLNKLEVRGEKELESYIELSKARSYKADAMFRIARFNHAKGNYSRRDVFIRKVHSQDIYLTNFDKQALAEVDYLKGRPAALSKVRFLFDSGDYLTALSVLNTDSIDSYSPFYQVEWWYRLARTEQSLKRHDKAIDAYNKVIELAVDDSRYYGPYSALFAAQINLKKNNQEKVLFYLKKAEVLNSGEYKKDISMRIEALYKQMQ